jgi:hypothetical protein
MQTTTLFNPGFSNINQADDVGFKSDGKCKKLVFVIRLTSLL